MCLFYKLRKLKWLNMINCFTILNWHLYYNIILCKSPLYIVTIECKKVDKRFLAACSRLSFLIFLDFDWTLIKKWVFTLKDWRKKTRITITFCRKTITGSCCQLFFGTDFMYEKIDIIWGVKADWIPSQIRPVFLKNGKK